MTSQSLLMKANEKEEDMRYLSFDIECCDGQHICEFGYVITDEHFFVIEKEVLIINPDKKFNLTGRPHQDDLILFFPEGTYYAGEQFPYYYQRIKELLEKKDQIVIGHSVANDAGFIRTACKRYKLDPINFYFFDSQKVYSEYANEKGQISLENAGKILHLEKPAFLHKSDDDAFLTLQMMQKMCESLSVSLLELKDLCPTANGISRNFNIHYVGSSLPEMLEALSKNVNSLSNGRKAKCIKQFAEKVEAQGPIINSKVSGCKLCFSTAFEKSNIKDVLVLIQLLADHGCQYNTKVSENDFYVATQEELETSEVEEHTRYYSALHNTETLCKVISFNQLYEMLFTTEEEVKAAPWPKMGKKKTTQKKVYSTGGARSTIGDQLKAKGIDLSKLFKTE